MISTVAFASIPDRPILALALAATVVCVLAGCAATEALGLLDRVRSYPTTIFADAAGEVRAVHTGFAGPATGEAHAALRARFEAIIEELLAE